MKCNNCGEILLEKDKFCSKCGTKVGETKKEVVAVSKPVKKKTKPYWLIMLVPLVLFVLSVVFGFIVNILAYEYSLYMDPIYPLFNIVRGLRIVTVIAFILCFALTIFLYVKSSKRK